MRLRSNSTSFQATREDTHTWSSTSLNFGFGQLMLGPEAKLEELLAI